jgi:hypothetical protein
MRSPVWGKSGPSSPGFPKWEGCPHFSEMSLIDTLEPRECVGMYLQLLSCQLTIYIDPVTTRVHQNREKLSSFSVNCKELCVALLPGLLRPPECAAHIRGLSKFGNMCSCSVWPYFLSSVACTNVHDHLRLRFLRLNAASNSCY